MKLNKQKMADLVLLEPTASVLGLSTYAAHNILEPIGLEYLASYLEERGYQCNVLQQRCEPRAKILAEIVESKPDVLGISTQAYNVDDALWFAKEAKNALSGLITVFGGYHASACTELVEKPEVDYVIVGEGETAFSELLAVLSQGRPLTDVPGLAYFDGAVRVTTRPGRIDNLDALPFPKRDRSILTQCRMHGLMYPPPSRQTYVGMVTATRGCPYSCAFCCSQLIWDHKVRRRSPKNVADEMELLVHDFGVNAVFFCDLTFNASKPYVLELCSEIARRDIPMHFYAMCHLRGMDREIADAMVAAKCAKIGFGVESFTDAVRENMKDQGGMDIGETNRILDEVSAAGVLTKTYFIIGFPWETRDTLVQMQADISELHADEIKATFYVPFPGTEGYEMHKSLLTTHDWSDFTTLSKPIVRNDALSAEELQQIRKDIFSGFYNGQYWRDRVAARIREFPKYRDSFGEFVAFLREQGVLQLPVSIPEVGEVHG